MPPASAALDPAIYAANLAALSESQPAAAGLLKSISPDPQWTAASARDGALTLVRRDPRGDSWLGRTTMPRIRAHALIESFDPGAGNVAFVGFGHGMEIKLLLDRIAPVQAILVIEESAQIVSNVLRVVNFAAAMRARRLLLFTGPAAWDDVADFLRTNVGVLSPERVMNWPWFTPPESTAIADRLGRIAADAQAHRRDHAGASPTAAENRSVDLVIVAPDGGGRAGSVARSLDRAAAQAAISTIAVIADSPLHRHPAFIAHLLKGASSADAILVAAAPDMLPDHLRSARCIVWCPEEWLSGVGARAHPPASKAPNHWSALIDRVRPVDRVVVPYVSMGEELVRAGLPRSQVRHVPPGADEQSAAATLPARIDVSARAAGLNLESHQALWEVLTKSIKATISIWQDAFATPLLNDAESQSGIRLHSDEVRAGLVERITKLLGPGLERNLYLDAWESSGADDGSADSPMLLLPPEGRVSSALLEAALHHVLFIRANPGQSGDDGWSRFLNENEHVTLVESPADLKRRLATYRNQPQPFLGKKAAARQHVLTHHRWTDRLRAALRE